MAALRTSARDGPARRTSARTLLCLGVAAAAGAASVLFAPSSSFVGTSSGLQLTKARRGDVSMKFKVNTAVVHSPEALSRGGVKGGFLPETRIFTAAAPRILGYVHGHPDFKSEGLRIRMKRSKMNAPMGPPRWVYDIIVTQRKKQHAYTYAYKEQIGTYDPWQKTSHPDFFSMRADRVVYWLNQGAQPTDTPATLMERAGLIRRTGPLSSRGEWEWRVPATSGPEAPEGWSFEGTQPVTWNNQPELSPHRRHQKAAFKKRTEKRSLIEMYGFRGYEKVPYDFEVSTAPALGVALTKNFPNTNLPIF
mmetsp:Transcript_83547/g.240057  ORF Transcript_83547/g.240057 Transcript_83547/m.240057 type:complete len:307 (-) Transcript_83547:90-1010(-)|eukprot:CAMPEP_0177284824 /NCGR_PEP_ID=MMETSP0367-20130122/72737_1 /TAXON_ID=447022 ORGANISM="Scrippsiella hangoei-like, Strain SHHI-4" /NCGR_SAMPLE_ID=MMETSP0367 /ASSEMBLY_ACC=CAM_ASM_000362 /LENGTH=306 /DNA_ID=CAMNT_0018741913 /DNA_START=82 /DNA_END=1002 /DNA_ORIENTATION=-